MKSFLLSVILSLSLALSFPQAFAAQPEELKKELEQLEEKLHIALQSLAHAKQIRTEKGIIYALADGGEALSSAGKGISFFTLFINSVRSLFTSDFVFRPSGSVAVEIEGSTYFFRPAPSGKKQFEVFLKLEEIAMDGISPTTSRIEKLTRKEASKYIPDLRRRELRHFRGTDPLNFPKSFISEGSAFRSVAIPILLFGGFLFAEYFFHSLKETKYAITTVETGEPITEEERNRLMKVIPELIEQIESIQAELEQTNHANLQSQNHSGNHS